MEHEKLIDVASVPINNLISLFCFLWAFFSVVILLIFMSICTPSLMWRGGSLKVLSMNVLYVQGYLSFSCNRKIVSLKAR